jgi:hypothetical protein
MISESQQMLSDCDELFNDSLRSSDLHSETGNSIQSELKMRRFAQGVT